MLITIHGKDMTKIGFLSNTIPNAVKFSKDKWHRYRSSGISTYDFSVSKKNPNYKNIRLEEATYFSFRWKGRDHVFSITRAFDSTASEYIHFETIDCNASIIYEEAPKIENTASQSLVWYLERSGILGDGQFKIATNEVANARRTLKYEGETDTKLARLQDLMASFDAEFEMETVLHNSGRLKEVKLHIYREHSETSQGVGRRRTDLPPLMSDTGLKVVGHDVDYKSIYTAVRVDGKDGLNFEDSTAEILSPDGQVEFRKVWGDLYYRAPRAAELYPGNIKQVGLNIVSYREKHLKTEYSDKSQLLAHALSYLKNNAYPKIKFTASAEPYVVRNERFDIDLGDTWELSTKEITNDDRSPLLLQFRVDEIIMSHTDPENDELVFSNFKRLKSKISANLLDRVKELVEQRLPYTLELQTSNGTVFKNHQGTSMVTPKLKRGTEEIAGASFVWTVGNDSQRAQTYSVVAESIVGTVLVRVEAILNEQVVARGEITFATVSDGEEGIPGPTGPQGPEGARGAQGARAYFFMAYADSDSGAGFSLTDASKRYMGYYSNHTPTQSISPTAYKWVDRSNVVATFVQSTVPENPPEGARWKYTGRAAMTVGSTVIAIGEQYLFISGEWIKDVITSDNLQIKPAFIEGEMIKEKAVTVDKLSVDSLSAVSANLGHVTAGDILLQRSFDSGKSVRPVYTIPAYKTGLFMDNHGLIVNGSPVQKVSTEAIASDMPVVAITSGEVRFLRADLTDDIKTMLHQGLSDPDYGFIQFGRDKENRNALVVSSNGQIYLSGENYTDWSDSTVNNKVKWKVQGNLVIVDYDVSFSSGGNKHIVSVPTKYVPKALMLKASAWYTTTAKDKKAQLNADGGLHILNVDVNQRYCGQIVWAY